MSGERDARLADNLRRWQESGEPLRWVEGHQGQWARDELLGLVEGLGRSEFWPLDPASVEEVLNRLTAEWWNLRHWQGSCQPRRWVEGRQGEWQHHDWLFLLETLGRSHFWPLAPEAVRRVLEEVKRQYWNLRRWQQSGWPRRWVEARQGRWSHDDWLGLLEWLRRSEFWPLDLDMVGLVLDDLKAQWWNLRLWQQSGQPREWVEAREGKWSHDDWLALLESLQHSEYWPLSPEAVGATLEEVRKGWWNLRRWQQCGQAQCWVASQQGRWTQEEWRAMLATLEQSEYGPLDPEGVRMVVEDARQRFCALRSWERSGQARRWVQERRGRWSQEDWQDLLETLRQAGYWPLDPDALAEVLRELKAEWWNLQRWRTAGLARRWVEARGGRWGADDWLDLLADLMQSEFWPADPDSVRRVLEEARAEWGNLRRWLETGEAQRWASAGPDGGARRDWPALLESLRRSEFWPLDPEAVRQALEGLRGRKTQAA
jgi:hypothetical protein